MAEKSIAAIGDRDFTAGFELAGVSESCNPSSFGEKVLELIGTDDIGIVVAEKSDVEQLPERDKRKVRNSVDPVVVELSEEAKTANLNEKIRKVIGADIA